MRVFIPATHSMLADFARDQVLPIRHPQRDEPADRGGDRRRQAQQDRNQHEISLRTAHFVIQCFIAI